MIMPGVRKDVIGSRLRQDAALDEDLARLGERRKGVVTGTVSPSPDSSVDKSGAASGPEPANSAQRSMAAEDERDSIQRSVRSMYEKRHGKQARKGGKPECFAQLRVSAGLRDALMLEKARLSLEKGRFLSINEIVEEYVVSGIKRSCREMYDRYRSLGFIK